MKLPDELLKIPHRREIPFRNLTTLGVGGVCRWLFEPTTEVQVLDFVQSCRKEGLPFRVLGRGSNLLVLGDIEEPVLRLAFPEDLQVQGGQITAPGNLSGPRFCRMLAEKGFSGLEWASGIPGSVGGGVRMNAGAQGANWSQRLVKLRYLNEEGERVEREPKEGDFAYRWSFLKRGGLLLQATVELASGNPSTIRQEMEAILAQRKATQPLQHRSAGCFFKNPPNLFRGDRPATLEAAETSDAKGRGLFVPPDPRMECEQSPHSMPEGLSGYNPPNTSAGQLIQEAGLKGKTFGGVLISPIHGNFLLNVDRAKGEDFQHAIQEVRVKIYEKYGIILELEVEIWPECSAFLELS